ncbi:MAG: hypothetical protein JNN22_12490 [Rhodospirillales bacterium]|nr:hypothetical protein [Rhodospirillales bacterium]
MALTIAQATKPILDFRNAKNDSLNRVTVDFADQTKQRVLKQVSEGNQIAGNSLAAINGRGNNINISA